MAPHRIADSVRRRLFLTALVPLLALIFLLGPAAAQATTVVNFGPTAIGIRDLNVPGFAQPFNVLFDTGSAADLYSNPPPFDFASQAEAAAAVVAVNTVLTLENAISTVGGFSASFYLVPFSREGSLVLAEGGAHAGDLSWNSLGGVQDFQFTQPGSYAVFTPVPEPGTALLMGLGLVSLGVVGRSRREESERTA